MMSVSLPVAEQTSSLSSLDFSSFLSHYREKLRWLFHKRTNFDALSTRRGLPPFVMREIRSCHPLSVFISEEYGGRGGHPHECQAMLQASSYESLALSLAMGINGALFIQPVTKYGDDAIKAPIFRRFMESKSLGGLMITEPDFGTDALAMQTSYVETETGYELQGCKHWGGLTGWADFWLIAARRSNGDGQLARDIDFFVCDVSQPGQHIEVEEYYNNLGLYLIPYGRNRIELTLPQEARLKPRSTGIKMMLDLLHRSRIQFPGMGMGYLQRLLDEAITHCRERYVGGHSLFNYDQVKSRLAELQAFFTACSSMCAYASEHAHLDRDLSKLSLEANAIKAVITDMMQEAADSFVQLKGAMGYRLDDLAGRAYVDSRPFQIFEGSNDILYQQVSESVLKSMRRMKERNLYNYLKTNGVTARAADHFKDVLDVEVELQMPQRKLVELGQAISRIITMELVIELGDRGFRSDLISNCLSVLKQTVDGLMTTYQSPTLPAIVEDYVEEGSWLPYVSAERS